MKTDSSRAPRGRFAARVRPRGYTLVEIALAMLVIGLLLGASALTARHLEERRQLQREMEKMERVRDAIVGYALRNRTSARNVKFEINPAPNQFDSTPTEWWFQFPAGRPYLPCPDWNGDGFEDRVPEGGNGFRQGVETRPDLTVTLILRTNREFASDIFPPRRRTFLSWGVENGRRHLGYPYGECRVARGAIPWRTLGVEPTDRWGNRHTYYADPVFSNAIFGFDRRTVADIFDPRIPRAQGFNHAERFHTHIQSYPASILDGRIDFHVPSCPAVICDGRRSPNCAFNHITELLIYDHILLDPNPCRWVADLEGLILKAGAVTKRTIPPVSSGGRYIPAGAVTDGLPFVIVSHGPNGRYAVNHWKTLRNPLDFLGVMVPSCNLPGVALSPEDSPRGLTHEAANGRRLSPNVPRYFNHGVNQNCYTLSDHAIPGGNPGSNKAFFVWHPPTVGGEDDFDDLLLWTTRGELTSAITGSIPPLPPLVVIAF